MANKNDDFGIGRLTKQLEGLLKNAETMTHTALQIKEHEKIQVNKNGMKFDAARMNNNVVTLVFQNEADQKKFFDQFKKK